jgi:hypothetical protein
LRTQVLCDVVLTAITRRSEPMSMTPIDDDRKKRVDPYDPRTGATGNDEPSEIDDDEDLGDDDEVEGEESER